MFWPSSVMEPAVWSYHRSRRATHVDFPDPLAPTRAVVLPAGMESESPLRTWLSGREGYENTTSFSSMFPVHCSGFRPLVAMGSICEGLSIVWKSSIAAVAALVMLKICIMTVVIAVAATIRANITLPHGQLSSSRQSCCSRYAPVCVHRSFVNTDVGSVSLTYVMMVPGSGISPEMYILIPCQKASCSTYVSITMHQLNKSLASGKL